MHFAPVLAGSGPSNQIGDLFMNGSHFNRRLSVLLMTVVVGLPFGVWSPPALAVAPEERCFVVQLKATAKAFKGRMKCLIGSAFNSTFDSDRCHNENEAKLFFTFVKSITVGGGECSFQSDPFSNPSAAASPWEDLQQVTDTFHADAGLGSATLAHKACVKMKVAAASRLYVSFAKCLVKTVTKPADFGEAELLACKADASARFEATMLKASTKACPPQSEPNDWLENMIHAAHVDVSNCLDNPADCS